MFIHTVDTKFDFILYTTIAATSVNFVIMWLAVRLSKKYVWNVFLTIKQIQYKFYSAKVSWIESCQHFTLNSIGCI